MYHATDPMLDTSQILLTKSSKVDVSIPTILAGHLGSERLNYWPKMITNKKSGSGNWHQLNQSFDTPGAVVGML